MQHICCCCRSSWKAGGATGLPTGPCLSWASQSCAHGTSPFHCGSTTITTTRAVGTGAIITADLPNLLGLCQGTCCTCSSCHLLLAARYTAQAVCAPSMTSWPSADAQVPRLLTLLQPQRVPDLGTTCLTAFTCPSHYHQAPLLHLTPPSPSRHHRSYKSCAYAAQVYHLWETLMASQELLVQHLRIAERHPGWISMKAGVGAV